MAVAARTVKTYGVIERHGVLWAIDAEPHVLIRLRRLFPRVQSSRGGEILVHATNEVSRDLEWVMQRWPMEMCDDDREQLEAESRAHVEQEIRADDILGGEPPDFDLSWEGRNSNGDTPHEDQLIGANLAMAMGRLLIVDEVGMGKSLTGLLTMRNGGMLPGLIVCQTHLQTQWLEQVREWTPLRGHIARKGTPYRLADYTDGVPPDVLIMPYSKLAGWSKILAGRVRVVVFDEIQELRREGTQKYNAAAHIASLAEVKTGLTATPVYNYGEEVFNVVSILDRDLLGTRNEFFREWGKTIGRHVGVDNPAALSHWLKDQKAMVRRTWKDRGVDRGEPHKIPHSIDSDEHLLDAITADAVSMAEALVSREAAREELFRMSGEFDWKLRHATGLAKAGYVADFVRMLAEQGEQVVLFGWHHDVYDVWVKKLTKAGLCPVMYTGKETPRKKDVAKQWFLSGDSRVLIMSLRAGAGLDGLQEVSHICVFGELDWSPGIHDQCIGRLNRGNQEHPVLSYFLISDHGADPMIADVLNLKRQQAQGFVDPDAPLLRTADIGDRVQRLAADFLARRKS